MQYKQITRVFLSLPRFSQLLLLKALYKRKDKKLEAFESYSNGRFFVYKVNGKYVPSEALGWFVDYSFYEARMKTMATYAYQLKPGDVVIDIGAGLGEETLVFSELVGAQGKVFSVEANPNVFKVLQQVIDLNKLDNVYSHNIAISEDNGPVVIKDENESYLGGSVTKASVADNERSYQVQGFRFDSFIEENRIERIDLLKVNIEGAERFVISTVEKVLPLIKNFAIECHDFRYGKEGNEFFKTKELVVSFFREHGYNITSQETGIPYIDDWVYASK
jgi:FkbM family methyltransferase